MRAMLWAALLALRCVVTHALAMPTRDLLEEWFGRWTRAAGGTTHPVASTRHSALHQPQAAQPAGQGADAFARGVGRGLPAHDLRGECEAVHTRSASFLRKWRLRCKAVVNSLEEAGEELFTFLQFPSHSGRRCAPPTPWSGSTRSFAAAQDPGFAARRGRGAAPALRPAAQRPNSAAPHGRLAGHTQSNRQIAGCLERLTIY